VSDDFIRLVGMGKEESLKRLLEQTREVDGMLKSPLAEAVKRGDEGSTGEMLCELVRLAANMEFERNVLSASLKELIAHLNRNVDNEGVS
jgi:hypothetical protein